MDFTLTWHDPEHTILYLRVEGIWEIDATQRAIDLHRQKLLDVTHKVDLITHALDKDAMNLPPWMLRVGTRTTASMPPNAGLTVMVPRSTKILALTDAGIRLLGGRYEERLLTAATLDEAVQLLQDLRKNAQNPP